jgi:hypothetical protein
VSDSTNSFREDFEESARKADSFLVETVSLPIKDELQISAPSQIDYGTIARNRRVSSFSPPGVDRIDRCRMVLPEAPTGVSIRVSSIAPAAYRRI